MPGDSLFILVQPANFDRYAPVDQEVRRCTLSIRLEHHRTEVLARKILVDRLVPIRSFLGGWLGGPAFSVLAKHLAEFDENAYVTT